MREIKFRAWDKATREYWSIDKWHFEDEYLDLIEPGVSICDPNIKRIWRKRRDVELMQYTGLKDMNGVEIYENDIVKSNYKYAQPKISQIIMEDGNSYVAGEDLATGNEMLVSDHIGEIEIIGNVHANPELLKGGEMSNPETTKYSNDDVEWIAQESDFIREDVFNHANPQDPTMPDDMPVIPDYVAEYIEHTKSIDCDIWDAMHYFLRPDNVDEYMEDNSETFVRAWLDGYQTGGDKI